MAAESRHIFNFAARPALLPVPVLEQIRGSFPHRHRWRHEPGNSSRESGRFDGVLAAGELRPEAKVS
jgi:hypothetical protein